jgi:hypothetical protein
MKTLYEKLITLYPDLKTEDNRLDGITLMNDSDGLGDYIYRWDNLTISQPTQEELDAVE